MKIKQMLEDFWEGVMEVSPSAINSETICIVTDDNMENYTRKLIEAVGEELIHPLADMEFHEKRQVCGAEQYGFDTAIRRVDERQRFKLNEIINSIK